MTDMRAISLASKTHVLIHKRALFVNSLTISLLARCIKMNVTDPRLPTDEDIVNYFSDIATQEARKLTDQQISEITKQAITELNHQNKNLAPRAKT